MYSTRSNIFENKIILKHSVILSSSAKSLEDDTSEHEDIIACIEPHSTNVKSLR